MQQGALFMMTKTLALMTVVVAWVVAEVDMQTAQCILVVNEGSAGMQN
jgi:hypothetical protein